MAQVKRPGAEFLGNVWLLLACYQFSYQLSSKDWLKSGEAVNVSVEIFLSLASPAVLNQ